jgi:putative membrane protein insertion efficiency factor
MAFAPPAPEQAGTPDAEQLKQRGLRLAFRLYKSLLSPLIHVISPTRCVYLPTCSEYAYTAVSRFGVVRGAWLALCRLARCHPWAKGRFDPVPAPAPLPSPHAANAVSSRPVQTEADHLP